jgi:thiamine biosynthesis lipoprotein
VFCYGDVGLDLVNQLPGVGCIYVDDKGKIFEKNIDLKKFNNE